MDLLLGALALAAFGAAVWLVIRSHRRRGDEKALTKAKNLERLSDEEMARAEREGRRRRKLQRGDWS